MGGVDKQRSVKLKAEPASQDSPKLDEHYAKHGSAGLTGRHFGLSRSTFYKWKARYKPDYILSLEEHSKTPKNRRSPTTPLEAVGPTPN